MGESENEMLRYLYSRCHTLGLLEEDKSLKIEVRVEVLDELLTGGHIERRRLLQENNKSLAELKTLLVDQMKEKERERGECPVCQTTVECPVCSEEVRRPMRLTQCSQVNFSLSSSYPPPSPPPCALCRATSSVTTVWELWRPQRTKTRTVFFVR